MIKYHSTKRISTISKFIQASSRTAASRDFLLFRGQSKDWELLPKLVRVSGSNNQRAPEQEERIFNDFCRRSTSFFSQVPENDWDWLTVGQHFGLATRLIDWSSNPLVALWFACNEQVHGDSYVYCLNVPEQLEITDEDRRKKPKELASSRIYKPTMNNNRIIAQQGWFTVHAHNGDQFLPMHLDPLFRNSITKLEIHESAKPKMLSEISQLGINNRTLFPDLEGLSRHLNNKYGYNPR